MKTVVSYLRGIPNQKNPEKIQVLTRFIDGVNKVGDNGIVSTDPNWQLSDLGVIQGFVHQQSANSPHLRLRQSVLQNQRVNNKHTMIADSNLFLYADTFNPMHYLRFSLDGVFPTTGNYFTDRVDPNRWKSISKNLNISLKDWRDDGSHILICLQRNGGWSMKGLDVMMWLQQTILKIQQNSDRKIVVRAHPGDKRAKQYLRISHPNVKISKNVRLTDDLDKCWAVVTYNSSPGVAAAIEGIPIFVTDTTPQTSQAFDVSNQNLLDIENPKMFERQQWIEKIAMSHWNFNELSSGEAWATMRDYV